MKKNDFHHLLFFISLSQRWLGMLLCAFAELGSFTWVNRWIGSPPYYRLVVLVSGSDHRHGLWYGGGMADGILACHFVYLTPPLLLIYKLH